MKLSSHVTCVIYGTMQWLCNKTWTLYKTTRYLGSTNSIIKSILYDLKCSIIMFLCYCCPSNSQWELFTWSGHSTRETKAKHFIIITSICLTSVLWLHQLLLVMHVLSWLQNPLAIDPVYNIQLIPSLMPVTMVIINMLTDVLIDISVKSTSKMLSNQINSLLQGYTHLELLWCFLINLPVFLLSPVDWEIS